MTHKALIRQLQISCLGLDPIDPLRLLVDDVIEALREHAMREVQRLGQEIEQEPFAWFRYQQGSRVYYDTKKWDDCQPLYTQSASEWVGLTDEERNKLWREVVGWGDPSHDDEDLMKAIEAKLKELNT
jgi:hypothetical protein